jgi:adenylosuccinate lyase
VVNSPVIKKNVGELLPYMVTENLMMAAVRAGADRQEVHEIVRQHSHAVTARVKAGEGTSAELLQILKDETAFKKVDFAAIAGQQPHAFVGRSPEQTEEFVAEHVEPIRARYKRVLGKTAELHV